MKRKMKKEIKQEIDPELDVEFHEHHDEPKIVAETHKEINSHLCGEIEKLEFGYAELRLFTITEMVADNMDLIHGGFIFSAADYAAMLAVNKRNVILVACDAQFLSPAKLGDIIIIKATLRHKQGSKRNVNVIASVGDIKIFEAEFKTVVTERHVLKLHLHEESI